MFETLMLLVMAHFTVDIVLQSEKTALSKNRNFTPPSYRPEIHGKKMPVWVYELLGHASSHGLAVYLISQNIFLAMIEVQAHFLIDFLKGEKKFNIHVDQFLHILCKLFYAWWLI